MIPQELRQANAYGNCGPGTQHTPAWPWEITLWPIFAYHLDMSYAGPIVEPVDLCLPGLPPALSGLRIGHVSDLHAYRHRRRYRRIARELAQARPDLIVLTGDHVTRWRPANVAGEVLAGMCDQLDPPMGMFGVHGNHDANELRGELQALPITWLDNASHRFEGLPLEILGADTHFRSGHDSVALAEQLTPGQRTTPTVRLLLCHIPTFLPTASDLAADIMFAGHTHGGQIRLPGGRALCNSTDLPLDLTSGVLRHRNTLCCVSRGLGEVLLPCRLFCRPQLPIYTLCSGPMPGQYSDDIVNVLPW